MGLTMKRIALLAAVLLTLYVQYVSTYAQIDHPQGHITIEQRLSATDQEAQEGYFALGLGKGSLVLVVHHDSDLATYFRAHIGQRMRVMFVPLTEQ